MNLTYIPDSVDSNIADGNIAVNNIADSNTAVNVENRISLETEIKNLQQQLIDIKLELKHLLEKTTSYNEPQILLQTLPELSDLIIKTIVSRIENMLKFTVKVYKTTDIDNIENCLKQYLKQKQFKKYKEFYQVDVDDVTKLFKICNNATLSAKKVLSKTEQKGGYYIYLEKDT